MTAAIAKSAAFQIDRVTDLADNPAMIASTFRAATALSLLAATTVFPWPVQALDGLWLTQNGRGIVAFRSCAETGGDDAAVCGHMEWVAEPHDAEGALKRDANNPDTELRNRPLCALHLIGDLVQSANGRWENGWVYNPRDGERYGVRIDVTSETELKMRGFLGIALFGKTQTWTRVADNRGGCPED